MNSLGKVYVMFMAVGVIISALGIYLIISVMQDFPDDVNMFAVLMSLILLAIISAGCATGITYIVTNSRSENKVLKND